MQYFSKIMQTFYWRDFKDFKYLNRNDNKELFKIGHHMKDERADFSVGNGTSPISFY